MPIALASAAVCGLAFVALYNVGQTAAARVRLTHAADAAAYSGALAQARTLNLLAYINRAQVAHQMAMAHLVTLASWAQFGQTQSQQRIRGNPPMPLIAALFGKAAGQGYASATATAGAVPELAHAFQQHDQVVHQVLAQAAASAASRMPDTRQHTLHRVLQANYPEHYSPQATTLSSGPLRLQMLSDSGAGHVQTRSGKDATRLRGMVELAAGRHDFLRPRNITRESNWVVQPACPWRRHELRRRGGTWLSDDGRWGAVDTLSYHSLRSNRWIGCYYREYAMGWGLAGRQTLGESEYVNKPPQDFSGQDFWRWVHENTNWDLYTGKRNLLANSYAVVNGARWPSRGLPFYHDIAMGLENEPLRFAIQVQQAAMALPTTDAASRLAAPVGRYAYAALQGDDAVTVTSAAEAYYSAPDSTMGQAVPLASLFRPYWQARLSAVTADDISGSLP
ncbi:hypothetical protein LPZ50_01300 [Bordetella petrii]|nr:hypothetical protein [Bordetella petrii]MCD0501635.1 hypothetical protein [Bordetella petrii]